MNREIYRSSEDKQVSRQLLEKLRMAAPGGVELDVPLASLSRWKIGGPARVVVEPAGSEEAANVMKIMSQSAVPHTVIGEGSNVLFEDVGFDGVIIKIGTRMSQIRIEGTEVWAEAGVSVPELAWHVSSANLSGIEHTVGIPGTLGGLVLMNGGSQRKGIGINVTSVLCSDADGGLFELNQEDCQFSYRHSALQSMNAAVLEIRLQLATSHMIDIQEEMDAILDSRAQRFPVSAPSCGSTFLSDPAMFETVGAPGQAIEKAGLKGWRRGGAQISERHANFFVNLGGASSDDILWLIALARNTVREDTGFTMDCEVRHIDSTGAVRPAHEVAIERWGETLIRKSAVS